MEQYSWDSIKVVFALINANIEGNYENAHRGFVTVLNVMQRVGGETGVHWVLHYIRSL